MEEQMDLYKEKRKQFSKEAQKRIGAKADEIRSELSILRSADELTPHEAADLLNVSRPYLDKLLDEGIIPSRQVGVERRVRAQDVTKYKQTEQQRQEEILDALVKEAQDLDLGY
jgi:excisionase family DNA binding protein